MAKKKEFMDYLAPIVLGAGTIGVGALVIDWLKSKNYWPKPKSLEAGCDSCVGGEDPIVEAAKHL